MKLDQDTIDAVFAAAADARWATTNLGPRATVRHAGSMYTVEIDRSGRYLAEIVYQETYGGVTFLSSAHASHAQHATLKAAAATLA